MKRPLAVFGLWFTLAMLAAVLLVPSGFMPLALVVTAAFLFLCWWLLKGKRRRQILTMLAAVASALFYLAGFKAIVVEPLQEYAGQQCRVQARVLEAAPAFGGDVYQAGIRVLRMNGQRTSPFTVELAGIPEVKPGDLIEAEVRFSAISSRAVQRGKYAKGIYLRCNLAGEVKLLGKSHTLVTKLRVLQYHTGEKIQESLPVRLSTIGAAMSVGDKRFLSLDAKLAYQAAGLSHLLVVSGLHLSVLCGFLYSFLVFLGAPRKARALLGLAGVFALVLFTGFSPSVIRAGAVYGIVFLAMLAYRKADFLTSLGIAAMVLCLNNPYVAADVGLLLSFGGVFGVQAAARTKQILLHNRISKGKKELDKKWAFALETVLVPLFVTVATLPVLVWVGMTVTLWSLPANIIAIPLLPMVLLGAGGVVLFSFLPFLAPLAKLPALLMGVALSFLDRVTSFILGTGAGRFAIAGGFALVALLMIYWVVYMALRSKRYRFGLAATMILVALSLGLGAGLSRGTVQCVVAEGGANPSLVVIQNNRAVVLYRGRNTLPSVQRIFARHNVRECTALIDLRMTAESTEYIESLGSNDVIVVQREVVSRRSVEGLEDVLITVMRQGKGNFACVDVGGYKIGLAAGTVNIQSYGGVDILVGGSGAVAGTYNTLITGASVPDWWNGSAELVMNNGGATIWLRPGVSVQIKEAWDSFGEG